MAGVFLLGRIMASLVEATTPMAEIPFDKLKGEERQWRIESAARTLKDYAKLKRKENRQQKDPQRDILAPSAGGKLSSVSLTVQAF
jgi:hypothetical protein